MLLLLFLILILIVGMIVLEVYGKHNISTGIRYASMAIIMAPAGGSIVMLSLIIAGVDEVRGMLVFNFDYIRCLSLLPLIISILFGFVMSARLKDNHWYVGVMVVLTLLSTWIADLAYLFFMENAG